MTVTPRSVDGLPWRALGVLATHGTGGIDLGWLLGEVAGGVGGAVVLALISLVRGATAKAQYRRHLVAREMIANRRGATSWYRGGILCWTHARAA